MRAAFSAHRRHGRHGRLITRPSPAIMTTALSYTTSWDMISARERHADETKGRSEIPSRPQETTRLHKPAVNDGAMPPPAPGREEEAARPISPRRRAARRGLPATGA